MLQDKTQPNRLVITAELHRPNQRLDMSGNRTHTGEWRRTLARLSTQELASTATSPSMGPRIMSAVGRALTMLSGQFKQ